ncbi:hypothetical protein R69888_04976 [Paraburkholderia haematera]|uniref:Uncharacterized protein n=1 Tax=Paraburkholderia haematera TaxID=2793077 RepID=A0ABM8S8X6_9BURK|nr:hypothetical protein R69888_04976 [Paraburkholderia haematera]
MNQLAHIDRDGPIAIAIATAIATAIAIAIAVAVASGPRALLPEFITKLILERSPSIGRIRNLRIIR